MGRSTQPPEGGEGVPPDATADLLALARAGDEEAVTRLVQRFGPLLSRWAAGRLPGRARSLVDTEDLVQVSFVRVLKQLNRFEARRPGAFLAYLRKTLLNQLRNEIRRALSRPQGEPMAEELSDPKTSPLDLVARGEEMERYEAALSQLTDEQQAAIMMRLELNLKHAEIAEVLGRPSANAARMLTARAMHRLAEIWDQEGSS